nr:hypothetical protein [Tanacetum cinerariifolium]
KLLRTTNFLGAIIVVRNKDVTYRSKFKGFRRTTELW